MGNMAKERYIDAESLIEKMYAIPTTMSMLNSAPYGSIDHTVSILVQQMVETALSNFRFNLIDAIQTSATLDGPCFLCKSPRPDCETLPVDHYGGGASQP